MIVNNCRINEFFIFVGIGYLFEVFDRVWVLINSVREDSYFVLKIEDEGFIILIFDWNYDLIEILFFVNFNLNDIILDKCKKGKISWVNIMN